MRRWCAGLRECAWIISETTTGSVRAQMSAATLLLVLAAALAALAPVCLKEIIDCLSRVGGARPSVLLRLVGAYVGALTLCRVANEVRGLVFGGAEQRLFRLASERLFFHVMRLPLKFHVEMKTGAISQILDNGLEGFRIILRHVVLNLLPVIAELVTIAVVLGRVLTAPFVLLFCAASICYLVVFVRSAAGITSNARGAAAARAAAVAAMNDCLFNWETIKYFAAEARVEARVGLELKRCEAGWIGVYGCFALNGILVGGVFVVFLAGTVTYGVLQVRRGAMTIGDFVLISTYMLQVARPMETIGYAMQGISQGLAMLEGATRLLRAPAESLQDVSVRAVSGPGALEFIGVSASYPAGRAVLFGISFAVAAGCTLGVVGSSGSGKSTIVRLVMRLLEPDVGRILFDGHGISDMTLRELRGAIAVVSQTAALLNESVGFNISLGRKDADADEIERAARVAQIHDFIMTLPEGYDTVVGESGIRLSGGERQRISIARAVLKCPRIFVFDEATSALDSCTERVVLRGLRGISRSSTTLVIAHRLSSVAHADEIIVLDEGRVAERGTHEALLRQQGMYADMWHAQHDGGIAA